MHNGKVMCHLCISAFLGIRETEMLIVHITLKKIKINCQYVIYGMRLDQWDYLWVQDNPLKINERNLIT